MPQRAPTPLQVANSVKCVCFWYSWFFCFHVFISYCWIMKGCSTGLKEINEICLWGQNTVYIVVKVSQPFLCAAQSRTVSSENLWRSRSTEQSQSLKLYSRLDSNPIRTVQMCFIHNHSYKNKKQQQPNKRKILSLSSEICQLPWSQSNGLVLLTMCHLIREFVLIGRMRHRPEEIPGQPLKWATARICFSYNLNTGRNNTEPHLSITDCDVCTTRRHKRHDVLDTEEAPLRQRQWSVPACCLDYASRACRWRLIAVNRLHASTTNWELVCFARASTGSLVAVRELMIWGKRRWRREDRKHKLERKILWPAGKRAQVALFLSADHVVVPALLLLLVFDSPAWLIVWIAVLL